VASYLGEILLFSLKFTLTTFGELLNMTVFSFIYDYYVYERILAEASTDYQNDANLFCIIFDLISYAKTIKLPFTITMDINPVIG
jgi:hypothetical protein